MRRSRRRERMMRSKSARETLEEADDKLSGAGQGVRDVS